MVVTAARAFRSLLFAVVGVGADGLFVCNYVCTVQDKLHG